MVGGTDQPERTPSNLYLAQPAVRLFFNNLEELGLDTLPICVAKAPSSLSDDPALHGRPRDFQVTVRNIQVNSGAGFLVVLTGAIMRMPGLPRHPLAMDVRFLPDGTVEGIG